MDTVVQVFVSSQFKYNASISTFFGTWGTFTVSVSEVN